MFELFQCIKAVLGWFSSFPWLGWTWHSTFKKNGDQQGLLNKLQCLSSTQRGRLNHSACSSFSSGLLSCGMVSWGGLARGL